MKRYFLMFLMACLGGVTMAQPAYDYAVLKTETLDRGVVAIRQDDGKVAVGWRVLRSDRKGEPFDVYRNGIKLNSTPLISGGSFFIDQNPLKTTEAVYEVKGGAVSGRYALRADAPVNYIPVKIERPEERYSANDASVGDMDGDGQYEIILKWDPFNAHDNSHDGFTDPTIYDCYRLNGERLWRINLGRNIRSGAHYTPFLVYDFDGDGKAEVMMKTADGTCDGQGNVLGDSTANWCNEKGRILEGPEFITVFDGLTGRALDTKPYLPERGDVSAWGDKRGNRSERYLAAVGYLGHERDEDGQMKQVASAIFCRGYYTRTVLAAWDWDGFELKKRWIFDTNQPEWSTYAGQGNHNLRVADVDGDGLDEVTYGSMAVDHDGQGLYNTGFGHGDAIHLMAFDPKSNRLQVWDCHENRRDGSELRDARTGAVIFQIKSNTDVGRAMAADIDPTNPGLEMWSTDSHGIRNIKGEVIGTANLPVNFGIWWDGDLLRELLDHETITKYNWKKRTVDTLLKLEGCWFNNGTKSNPSLSADILGDWREEVIARDRESSELRIYVSTIPTDYRINCLMQDIPYRLSVATENVGYNQPPEPGFYFGADRTDYLK